MSQRLRVPAVCLALGAGACGDRHHAQPYGPPRPVGPDARFRPAPGRVGGAPVHGTRCEQRPGRRFGAHLELFADGFVIVIPPGIGVAPPHRREGAYVHGGRCTYPAVTRAPTGVIEVSTGAHVSLGDFFALWGQRLSRRRLAGFAARPGERVAAFVNGRRWTGEPGAIPLARHAVIVLEVGRFVPPHRAYLFPPGL